MRHVIFSTFIFVFVFQSILFSGNKTISNAGGNWGDNATWVEGSPPTAAEDVIATGTSGNVTINIAAVCRSINLTNYSGTLTHNAGIALSIGDGTVGAGNIALTFVAGMTYTLGDTVTSEIKFISTSATIQTVDFAGKTTGSVTYDGVAGSWIYAGEHNMGSATYLTLTNGTLDVNSQTVVWGLFSSNNGNARTLTMGSASIDLIGGVNSEFWNTNNVGGFTVTANTATVKITRASSGCCPLFRSASKNFNGMSLIFNGGGIYTMYASNSTFSNVTVNGGDPNNNGNDRLQINGSGTNFVVTSSLTFNGVSSAKRLTVHSNSGGSLRTITNAGATVSGKNTDFLDIKFTVVADLSAMTGGAGDLGGNVNIIFTTGINLFWKTTTGGTKSWRETSNWYTQTNGVNPAGRYPMGQDHVVFDSNSIGATGTIIDVDIYFRKRLGTNVTWTGVTNNPDWRFTNDSTILGSLTLDSNMSMSVNNSSRRLNLTGNGSNSTFTISGNGVSFPHYKVYIGSASSSNTIELGSHLEVENNLLSYNCIFDAKTFNVKAKQYVQYNATLNMGSGTWELTGIGDPSFYTGSVWEQRSGTLNSNTSTIKFSNTSISKKIFNGGAETYYNFLISGVGESIYEIQDSNTFNTIQTEKTVSHSILFTAGTNTTVTNFSVNGSANKLVTIGSVTNATHTLIKAGGGTVNIDYVYISNSIGSTAVWNAAGNSVDGGVNTNWAFGADLPGTWTNGNANNNWNDTGNWAGAAIPGNGVMVYFTKKYDFPCTINTGVNVKGIHFSPTFTQTVSQGANAITIGSNGFEVYGGVFSGGSQNITSSGKFLLAAGTVISTSANFQVSAQNGQTFNVDGGTFTHNGGLVTIAGTANANVSSPTGGRLNDLTLDTSGTVSGTIFVNNDFTRSAGSGNSLDADVSVGRHYLGTGGNAGGSGTIRFIGAVAQNFTNPNAPSVEINTTGSVDVPADITIGGGWTQTAGTVNWFSKKAIFNSLIDANVTITSGAFYDLELAKKSTNNVTLTNNSVIANDLTITSLSNLNGSGAEVAGNFIVTPVTWSGTGKIIFSGTGNSTISGVGRQGVTTEVNKTGGKVDMTGNLNIYNSGHDLTITAGELDLKGFNVTVADTFTINGTMSLKGSEVITVNSLTTSADANANFTISPTTSTIVYTDSAILAIITNLAKTFYSLTFGANKTHEIATGGGNGITVNGTMASNGASGSRSILRSVSNSGTAWELTLNGTSSLADKVDVKNSDASSGTAVLATGSLGRGTNTNWVALANIPSILSILATSNSGYYEEGDSVNITITFSQNIILSGGNLVVRLNSTGIIIVKPFASTNVLNVSYVVHDNQNSGTLDASSFTITGGTLRNAGGLDLDLSLPGINISSNKNISIFTSSSETSNRSDGNGGGGCHYSFSAVPNGSAEWLVLFLFLFHFVLFLRRK
ncbi:MAG: hypothetical protein COA79_16445 [Planctomycetota bacterium]|nr:MAG: hypothetical protein COA79_16445 [Planctomycetota bacterium]